MRYPQHWSWYSVIDPSQNPPPLVATSTLSRYTSCYQALKNTLWSKEETDNKLTDKTEQVTFGMK